MGARATTYALTTVYLYNLGQTSKAATRPVQVTVFRIYTKKSNARDNYNHSEASFCFLTYISVLKNFKNSLLFL